MKSKDNYAKQLYEIYEQGLSLAKVAQTVGTTRQSVYSLFKARGYKLRTVVLKPAQVFDGVKFTPNTDGYFRRTDGDRELMHRYVWMFYNGEIPFKFEIHHRNENKADNRIENLEMLSKAEHTRLYSPSCNQFVHRCGK